MDQADFYDHEVAAIGRTWAELQKKWSSRANTKENLTEFAKEANAAFIKMGFVANIRWENNLMIDPKTMQPYPIEIEIMGRVPGFEFTEKGVELYDHERKRDQVIKSKMRGEKFLGEKGPSNY